MIKINLLKMFQRGAVHGAEPDLWLDLHGTELKHFYKIRNWRFLIQLHLDVSMQSLHYEDMIDILKYEREFWHHDVIDPLLFS